MIRGKKDVDWGKHLSPEDMSYVAGRVDPNGWYPMLSFERMGNAILKEIAGGQVEAARMPVDDPTTHIELTMVHEVMILDHSGLELAMLQLGSAIKLYVAISVLAMLIDPMSGQATSLAAASHLATCLLIAIALGLTESLIARLKLRAVPQYIVVGLVAAGAAVLSMLGRTASS